MKADKEKGSSFAFKTARGQLDGFIKDGRR